MSDVSEIPMRSLASLVAVDPETIASGSSPTLEFLYIDISAAAEGRLTLPRERIALKDAPSRARRVVRSGDVLMSTVRPNLKAFAHCELPPELCVASTGFAVLRPVERNDSRYVLYSILSDTTARQIDRLVAGSNYPAITSSDVKRLQVPDFEPCARRAIAEILGTIDESIKQTEVLIAKMQQVSAGVMHELFTRGLAPDGRLRSTRAEAPHVYKQSPVGWIPNEWRTCALPSIAAYQHGRPFPSPEYSSEGVLLLRPGNLDISGFVRWDDGHTTRLPERLASEHPDAVLRAGDIVMNLTAQSLDDGFLGRVCIVTGSELSLLNQRIARFTPKNIDAGFLYWALRSPRVREQIDSRPQGMKVQHIYNSDLDRIQFAIPEEPKEQEAIAVRLFSTSQYLASLESSLEKTRVLKSGLMHDLLTGRVRVSVPSRTSE